MKTTSLKQLLSGTFKEFDEDRVLRLSAALAYYAIFSLGPLLLIIVGVVGLVLGQDNVRQQIEGQLQGAMGQQAAGIVHSMISASDKPRSSIITTIIGTVALVLGATGVFGQLQDALNTIWDVKPRPGRGIRGIIRDRFLSLAMVFGIGFLLLVSMVISAVLSASTGWIERNLGLPGWLGYVVDVVFSLAVLTVLFGGMFKFVPDVKIPWRNVWVGAFATAVLFTLGKVALGLYLGRESTSSPYGAAGSVVLILMWVYYAAVIVFLGAEFTQVYTRMQGVPVVPTSQAVALTETDRSNQGMPSWRKVAEAERAQAPSRGDREGPASS